MTTDVATLPPTAATTVPFQDLARHHLPLRDALRDAIDGVVSSNRFVGGPLLEAFQQAFAAFCGVNHCVPCASGTEALRLALCAVLGPGDGTQEIITVSHTFAATVEAVVAAGFRPVLVDVDPSTYVIDLDRIQAACTERTAAILPVHLYGRMVDMRRLASIGDRLGLAVVEDASQAHGAAFGGVRPGQFSDAACFSFYPGKNLGAFGDAGAIVCNDRAIAERAAQLADHGRTEKFRHERVGTNARMDAIQAAVLAVKLPHLAEWNRRRRRVAAMYDAGLADLPALTLPRSASSAYHVYHQYVVEVSNRDALRAALKEQGIECGIHYPVPVHEQPAYRHLTDGPASLPITHALCRRILSLPIYPELTDQQIESVCDAIRNRIEHTTPVAG